jgi:hypothetical protein
VVQKEVQVAVECQAGDNKKWRTGEHSLVLGKQHKIINICPYKLFNGLIIRSP